MWDTINDCYINNLAKNQVSAVFHSHIICRALYADTMFVPFGGAQTWQP